MEIFMGLMFLLLGLCVGSFINMLEYRMAARYGLIKDKILKQVSDDKRLSRSFCDSCGKQLEWYQNIPVLSWLIQNGKAACCAKKLPLAYPMIEMLTGVFFVVLFYKYPGIGWMGLGLGMLVITLLIFSALFDWKYMVLPDFSTSILVIISFVGVLFDEKNIIPYLLSALGASGFLLFLHLVTKGRGMGMGDVKYALFMGLLLGWPNIIIAFYVAFISGATVGVFMMITKKMKKNSLIPFGPFLIAATVVSWWWGDKIWALGTNIWH